MAASSSRPVPDNTVAAITAPQQDLNLGIKTFLNGQLVSNIVIDTSAEATDTIDYVATDTAGNTATSTRTLIISGPERGKSMSARMSAMRATANVLYSM